MKNKSKKKHNKGIKNDLPRGSLSEVYFTLVLAIGELVSTLIIFNDVDEFASCSLTWIILCIFLIIKRDHTLISKLRPSILWFFFSMNCLFFYYILGKPLFSFMIEKYMFHNIEAVIKHKRMHFSQVFLFYDRISRDLGWVILTQSILMGYSCLFLSKRWRIFIGIVLPIILLFGVALVEKKLIF